LIIIGTGLIVGGVVAGGAAALKGAVNAADGFRFRIDENGIDFDLDLDNHGVDFDLDFDDAVNI
jgi:hypothetical protein